MKPTANILFPCLLENVISNYTRIIVPFVIIVFKQSFRHHQCHTLCQGGKQTLCVPDEYSSLYFLGYSDANLCADLTEFRINDIIVCFQNSSGASLYSVPEPFKFHRGRVSVKAQQRHEDVRFYLSLNHFLKPLLLSAGKQR